MRELWVEHQVVPTPTGFAARGVEWAVISAGVTSDSQGGVARQGVDLDTDLHRNELMALRNNVGADELKAVASGEKAIGAMGTTYLEYIANQVGRAIDAFCGGGFECDAG